MSTIEINYNKSVSIERFDENESGIGEQYGTHLVNVPCHIQPLDESYSEDLAGSFGKDFFMFCGVADIVEGDRVIDGADEYRIYGVKSHNFLGKARHMELRIRKFK